MQLLFRRFHKANDTITSHISTLARSYRCSMTPNQVTSIMILNNSKRGWKWLFDGINRDGARMTQNFHALKSGVQLLVVLALFSLRPENICGTEPIHETLPSLRVGVAEADITPPADFPMAGYYHERLAEGEMDSL